MDGNEGDSSKTFLIPGDPSRVPPPRRFKRVASNGRFKPPRQTPLQTITAPLGFNSFCTYHSIVRRNPSRKGTRARHPKKSLALLVSSERRGCPSGLVWSQITSPA